MFASSLLLTLTLSGSGAPAPSCPALSGDPLEHVPASATTVVGLDVDALAKTAVGRALLPALRADLQIAEALEILDDCGLELARTYAMIAARDAGEGRMLVVQGRGLGERSTLTCLEAELQARSEGASPWTREAGTCGESLALRDGSRAWVVNDYTLVWARAGLADRVAEQLEGRAPLACQIAGTDEAPSACPEAERGALAEPLAARVDREAQLWLASTLSAGDRDALAGSGPAAGWARDTQQITASMRFDAGMQGSATFTAPDAEALVRLRERVVAAFLRAAERLDDYGIEHRLRDNTRLGIVEDFVAVEFEISARELAAIRERVAERVRGRGPL